MNNSSEFPPKTKAEALEGWDPNIVPLASLMEIQEVDEPWAKEGYRELPPEGKIKVVETAITNFNNILRSGHFQRVLLLVLGCVGAFNATQAQSSNIDSGDHDFPNQGGLDMLQSWNFSPDVIAQVAQEIVNEQERGDFNDMVNMEQDTIPAFDYFSKMVPSGKEKVPPKTPPPPAPKVNPDGDKTSFDYFSNVNKESVTNEDFVYPYPKDTLSNPKYGTLNGVDNTPYYAKRKAVDLNIKGPYVLPDSVNASSLNRIKVGARSLADQDKMHWILNLDEKGNVYLMRVQGDQELLLHQGNKYLPGCLNRAIPVMIDEGVEPEPKIEPAKEAAKESPKTPPPEAVYRPEGVPTVKVFLKYEGGATLKKGSTMFCVYGYSGDISHLNLVKIWKYFPTKAAFSECHYEDLASNDYLYKMSVNAARKSGYHLEDGPLLISDVGVNGSFTVTPLEIPLEVLRAQVAQAEKEAAERAELKARLKQANTY